MAENLQKYGVKLEFQKALAGIKKLQDATRKLNKNHEAHARRQTNMIKAKDTLLAQSLKKEQTTYDKTQTAMTKRHERELKERTRREVAAAKGKLQQDKIASGIGSARRVQAVQGITAPSGAESMRQYYKEQERAANKAAAASARNENALKKARETISNTLMMQKKATTKAEQQYQANVKNHMITAKTTSELRRLVAQERASLKVTKQKTFLLKRMESSSQQLAGNMVSAFAVTAGAGFIVQTGQDFEAVNNTMLAVSDSAEQAGDNFKFVQDEAFRLGLGLTESAKGFAKMLAARGELSLEDTKESFKGVSEMSTLLGLSADESNRAINALQQISGLAS
ncbi:hypothetical protein KUA24_49 [Vibrio phage HNL01]|nr:hypothetical protein KUA24_49 [Vibrio phage HNL01]